VSLFYDREGHMGDQSSSGNLNQKIDVAGEKQEVEIAELTSRFLDGDLASGEFDCLQQQLKRDPVARRYFIDRMLMDAHLPDLLSTGTIGDMVDVLNGTVNDDLDGADSCLLTGQGISGRQERREINHKRSSLFSLKNSLAFSLLVLMGCAGMWSLGWFQAGPALVEVKSLAVVSRLRDVRPQDLKQPLAVGQKLNAGIVALESGTAEILLQNNVKVLLQGPAELELIDPMHAYLRRGRALFNVPSEAIGFVCETSEASIIDLGTEFGVHAGEASGTAVQVYVGEVIANAIANEDSELRGRRVRSGQAVKIVKGYQAVPEELRFAPNRFVRFLPDPNDGDDPEKTETGIYNNARHQELHIVRAPAEIEIDGLLNDWDLTGQFASRCEPPFDSFYYVRGAAMYDEQYLYLSAEVGDPFPMRSKVSPHIQRSLYGHGGCLAFRISTDRRMGWPVRGRSINDEEEEGFRQLLPEDLNDQLAFLVLWYYEPEKLPCLHVKYGMDEHDRKVNPPGYAGAFQKRADGLGYTAEYAIPWSLLNAGDDPPQAGDTLGLTWLVHWSGPEGQNWRGQLIDIVNPAITGWNYNQAGTWGRAIYDPRPGGSATGTK